MPDTQVSGKPALEQFRDAMLENGITPPENIISDGEFHRFSTNGKPNGGAGWYVFNEGTMPTGSFGDDRTGVKVKSWRANLGRALSATEKSDFKSKQETLIVERAAKKKRLHTMAKERADRIMGVVTLANDEHPYLVKKHVGAHGIALWDDPFVSIVYHKETGQPNLQLLSRDGKTQLRFGIDLEGKTPEEVCQVWKSLLVIPMFDDSGEVQSLQFISKKGDKKFLYGGKMQGCYFPLGDLKNAEIIMIAEGYATAATVHEITGHPVVVAYNAGNLLAVAKSIRAQHPKATLYLCADDDYKTKGNPGITKAIEAAEMVGGGVIIPEFAEDRPDGATDFNDMVAYIGKDAVTGFFTSRFSEMDDDPADDEPKALVCQTHEHGGDLPHNPETTRVPASMQYVPVPEPIAKPKMHFSTEELEFITNIWRDVPRHITRHSANGYDILLDERRKVVVTKNRIELGRKPRHRTDASYAAACEYARLFWNGQMEVHGDKPHRIKAWAFATVHGIEIPKPISSLRGRSIFRVATARKPCRVLPQAITMPSLSRTRLLNCCPCRTSCSTPIWKRSWRHWKRPSAKPMSIRAIAASSKCWKPPKNA